MIRPIRSSAFGLFGLMALFAGSAAAQLAVSPSTSLVFNVPVGPTDSAPQSITVTSISSGTFSAINPPANSEWLKIDNNVARANTTTTTWTFRVNPGSLASGISRTTSFFLVHDSGGTRQIDITMNVGTGSGGTILTATPSSLNFITAPGGTASQPLTVTNVGAAVQYTIASNQSWLTTNPATGTTITTSATPITVSVNSALLGGATSASGQLTLTPVGGGAATFVSVGISTSTSNNFQVSPSALSFNFVAGSGGLNPSGVLTLTSTGGVTSYNAPTIDYTGGSSTGWLSISPNSAGNTNANPGVSFTVSAVTSGLAVGTYTARVNFSGPVSNSPFQVPVTLNITGTGSLVPAPTSINFVAQPGANPLGQSLTVNASAGGAVNFTPTVVYTSPTNPAVNWLLVGNANVNLTTSSTLSVNALTTNGSQTLPLGEYNAVVRLTLTGTSTAVDVPVKLTVTNNAVLSVSTNSLTFSAAAGATPTQQQFTVSQVPANGSFFIQFIQGPGTPTNIIQTISPQTGTLSATGTTVTVQANFAGIAAGTYTGTLRVGSTISGTVGNPQDIALTFNVGGSGGGGTGSGPTDFVFPGLLRFFAANGSSSSLSQQLALASTGGVLNWTLTPQGAPWLSVTPGAGTTPGTPTVTVNPTGLSGNSTSFGQLLISGTGTTRDGTSILVQLDLNSSAQATVNPSALVFSYVIGSGVQPPNQSITVSSTTGAALSYNATASSTSNWLQVSPASGTTNGSNVVVSLNSGALLSLTTAGVYDGSITFTTTGGVNNTITVPVRLVLTTTGGGGGTGGGSSLNTLVYTPSSMSFFSQAGVNPPSQNILLINPSGTPTFSATASTSSGGSWLQISVNPSGIITVTPNAAGLSPGAYSGSILVSSSQLPGGSATIAVNLTVTSTVAIVPLPQGMVFSWPGGGAPLPSPQALTLITTNSSSVPFTVNTTTNSGGGWLSVATGGATSAPTSVNVSVNPSGLPAGVYTGTITVSTSSTANPSQTIDVRLIVQTGGGSVGAFQFNPTSLRFFAQPNGAQPPNQQVAVSTTGLVTSYLVTTQVNTPAGGTWLQAGPASGTTPGSLSVGVNQFGLSNGTYTGTVTVTGGGQSSSFNVELVVTNNPLIVASTRGVTFNYQTGAAVAGPRAIALTTSNNTPLNFSAVVSSTNTPWLQVAQPSSQTPGIIGVSLVPSAVQSLSANTYQGTITVTANGADNSPLQIPVTLNVASTPQLVLSSNSPVTFNAAFAGAPPPAQTLTVSSTSTVLNVTTQATTASGGSWLNATLNSSVTPATLSITAASAGLTTGVYNGTVTVTSSANGVNTSTVTIPVVLNVSSQPLLNVTPRELNFGGAGSSTQQQSISIISTSGTAGYSVSSAVATPAGGNWLQVSAAQATGATPGTVQISTVPAGLADGTYYGTVTVSATGVANSPIVIPVTLTVNNATALLVSPTDLTFGVQQGGALPPVQSVSVTSLVSTSFIVTVQPGAGTSAVNWLDVTPTSGLTSSVLSVRPNSVASSLAPGRYIAVVTVSGTGSPNTAQFNVTLNVSPSFVVTAAPTSLNFSGRERGANPAPQSVTVTTTGGATQVAASVSTTTGGNWLSVSPNSGNTPAGFNVSVNLAGLTQGSYTGAVTFTAAGVAPFVVPVSLTVDRAVTATITSIANGASFQPGALAPGLIVSIFGSGIGPDTGQGLQVVAGRVTRSLAGVRVLFDGIEAPLLFVRQDQINCVVPYQMAGRAQATVQVEFNGALSNSITPRIADTAPAIFNIGGTQAAMLNQDNTVNGPSNAALRGSIGVLYLTGEGSLTPPGVDGEVTNSVKRPIAPVSVRVGGVDVTNVAFVGAAPGLVQGVLQLNFTIPDNAPVGGAIPVEVTIGGQRTQANMTIAVR